MNYLIGLTFCLVVSYFAIKNMGAYAVLLAVLWGVFLAKPLLEAMIWIYKRIRDAPLKPFQGHYFMFDNIQVRVLEIESALWLVDEDCFKMLSLSVSESARRLSNPTEYQYIADKKLWVFSETGILRFLQNCQHPHTQRFKFWLEREVYLPHRNKIKYK